MNYRTHPNISQVKQIEFESFLDGLLYEIRKKGVSGFKNRRIYKYPLWQKIKQYPHILLKRLTRLELAILNLLIKLTNGKRDIIYSHAFIAHKVGAHVKYVCEVISRLHYLGLFFKRQRGLKETCIIMLDPWFHRLEVRNRIACFLSAAKEGIKWLQNVELLQSKKRDQIENPTHVLKGVIREFNRDNIVGNTNNKYTYTYEDNPISNSLPYGNIFNRKRNEPDDDRKKRMVTTTNGNEYYDEAEERNIEMNVDILSSILGNLHLLDE